MQEDYDDWVITNANNEEYAEGTMCTVTKWGTTSKGGSLARVLQKVNVPVISDEHCRGPYGASSIADYDLCWL